MANLVKRDELRATSSCHPGLRERRVASQLVSLVVWIPRRVLVGAALITLVLPASLVSGDGDSADVQRSISFGKTTPTGPPQIQRVEGDGIVCATGFRDPLCDPYSNHIIVRNSLGPCEPGFEVPCIEAVFARTTTNDWRAGTSLGALSSISNQAWAAKPEFSVGVPRHSNLYRFPEISHGRGELFEVNPRFVQFINRGNINPRYQLSAFIGAVYPDSTPRSSSDGCIPDLQDCWRYATNPTSNEFKLVLRLPRMPQFGWYTGQIHAPSVSYETLASGTNQPFRLTVAGGSLQVPTVSATFRSSDSDESAAWNRLTNTLFGRRWDLNVNFRPIDHSQYIKAVEAYPGFDIATENSSQWTFVADQVIGEMGSLAACYLPRSSGDWSEGFLGLMSSNALTYDSLLPVFGDADSTLRYRVSSPHLTPSGEPTKGYYTLLLSRRFANCVWKISTNSPVRASLEVLDEDGQQSVAVTSLGVDDAFVRFAATGFGFSEKTLVAKLMPVATKQERTTTIRCVRGKTVRRISGVDARCPKGFKQRP